MGQGPTRLVINGAPGSGKTRMASKLAAGLDIPHVELDAHYHGPGWVRADPEVFRAEVQALAEESSWVMDGNYGVVRDIIRSRAQLIVAIDLPRPVVFGALSARTLRRVITGEELWNGNRERWRNLVSTDLEQNLLLWTHANFAKYRARARADERASRNGGPKAVRLTSRAQMDRFIAYLTNRSESIS